ncbi:MAG: hypothetical protein R2794_07950 [Chitinophagales bacterium]
MESQSVLIVSEEAFSGMAIILSGYLQFYSDRKLHVYSNGHIYGHAEAEIVLAEDGITEYELEKAPMSGKLDLVIFIHPKTPKHQAGNFSIRELLVPENELVQENGNILDHYRRIREYIKRYAIACIGEIRLSAVQNS